MKPKIALTVGPDELNDDSWRTYEHAVERAGGEPLRVCAEFEASSVAQLLGEFDGLLIPGGRDLDPQTYGGRPHPTVRCNDPLRDCLELAAVRAAREDGVPAFGICRGIQVMNVALGGTLYEDLPSQYEPRSGPLVRHQQLPDAHRSETTHPVDVSAGSKLSQIVGSPRIDTNSMHHQGLRRIAHDLVVTGRSRDGVAEAIELRSAHPFFVGVQWHPEETAPRDEPSRRLFEDFIRAATERARRRRARAVSTSATKG